MRARLKRHVRALTVNIERRAASTLPRNIIRFADWVLENPTDSFNYSGSRIYVSCRETKKKKLKRVWVLDSYDNHVATVPLYRFNQVFFNDFSK